MKLHVTIDDRCQGHGVCYGFSPDVFEPDNEGFGTVKDLDIADGSELAEQARRAALGCPERAINVTDSGGS
jgi:ferredoxin